MSNLSVFGAAAVLACCGCSLLDPDPPAISGVIESRSTIVVGVTGGGLDTLPRILVNGADSGAVSSNCNQKALVTIVASAELLVGKARADTSKLVTGKHVTVWGEHQASLNCPPWIAAKKIVVDG